MNTKSDFVTSKRVLMVSSFSGYIEEMLEQMGREGYILQNVRDNYNWTANFDFCKDEPSDRSYYVFIARDREMSVDASEQYGISAYCKRMFVNGPNFYIGEVKEQFKSNVLAYQKKRNSILLWLYSVTVVLTSIVAGFTIHDMGKDTLAALFLPFPIFFLLIGLVGLFFVVRDVRAKRRKSRRQAPQEEL